MTAPVQIDPPRPKRITRERAAFWYGVEQVLGLVLLVIGGALLAGWGGALVGLGAGLWFKRY